MSVAEVIVPWMREEYVRSFQAAWEWLEPRSRTEEERRLSAALLLLLAPLNALVAPCRPAPGSPVNLQVTLSRAGPSGPERIRLLVRAGMGRHEGETRSQSDEETAREALTPELWLSPDVVASSPYGSAARVLEVLLRI